MPTARFQPSFAAGVLGQGLHGRVDIAKYDVGLKVGKNVFVHAHGGVSNRSGTEYVGEVMDSTKIHRLIPFVRDENENYIMLMGDQSMKIIENGAYVQDGGSDYNPSTPFAEADLIDLDYIQSIDVMYFASHNHFPQVMSRSALTSWTFADIETNPSVPAPTGLGVASKNTGTETYTYKVSPVVGGVEGFPSAEFSDTTSEDLSNDGAENVITWSGSADEYNIYRARNGVFGFIGYTSDTEFTDNNISPDLTLAPITASEVFQTSADWPTRVTLYQQRLVFANSINQPETIWMSKTGDFTNFTRSRILRDTDRIELDLSGQQVNRIQSLLQLRELLVFSSFGEFSITGPNGAMPATNPIQSQYGYSGASNVRPVVVDDTALFVDRSGRSVRDLRYAFEQDGYSGNDLSIFASHFFEGKTIGGWAFAKNPYSIIWVYLNDGSLLSFTYKKEHQVWAWCEHDIGGAVESMASIPEGDSDIVYMVVRREIDGQTKRYVERMRPRDFLRENPEDCFFVDSGITYTGVETTTISGLGHLEGKTVVGLADGDVTPLFTVSGGSVTLQQPASKVHIGLPYAAEIENLPPAVDLQDVGAARGRPTKASRLFIQLEKTRGIEVAPANRERFTTFTQTAFDLSLKIPLFTGMVSFNLYPEWNSDGTIVVRQTFPLPMTVLGISPELSIGKSG